MATHPSKPNLKVRTSRKSYFNRSRLYSLYTLYTVTWSPSIHKLEKLYSKNYFIAIDSYPFRV